MRCGACAHMTHQFAAFCKVMLSATAGTDAFCIIKIGPDPGKELEA